MKNQHPTMIRIYQQTGLKPTELAKILNTSPSTITNWGTRGISKQGALNVAEKLGLNANWVLTGEDPLSDPALHTEHASYDYYLIESLERIDALIASIKLAIKEGDSKRAVSLSDISQDLIKSLIKHKNND